MLRGTQLIHYEEQRVRAGQEALFGTYYLQKSRTALGGQTWRCAFPSRSLKQQAWAHETCNGHTALVRRQWHAPGGHCFFPPCRNSTCAYC